MIRMLLVWYLHKFGSNRFMYWGFMPDGSEWVSFYFLGRYRFKRCLDSPAQLNYTREQKICQSCEFKDYNGWCQMPDDARCPLV